MKTVLLKTTFEGKTISTLVEANKLLPSELIKQLEEAKEAIRRISPGELITLDGISFLIKPQEKEKIEHIINILEQKISDEYKRKRFKKTLKELVFSSPKLLTLTYKFHKHKYLGEYWPVVSFSSEVK